jgi:tetratricopeptide (TPR) repeat protein
MKSKTAHKVEVHYKRPFVIHLILIVGVFLLFGNALKNKYNFDDELVTVNHKLTSKGFSAIGDIFKSYYYEDDMGYKYEYRPVTTASFAIEHQLFGESPFISHLINVLLYALSVLLVYLIVLSISSRNVLFSAVTAIVFLCFPLHTEAVASIKNRDEILSLFFALLSTYFLLKFIQKKQHYMLVFIAIFFVASLLSKMSTLSFLLILPLLTIMFYNIDKTDFIKVCSAVLIPTICVLYLKETSINQIIKYATLAILLFVIFHFLSLYVKNKMPSFSLRSALEKFAVPNNTIIFSEGKKQLNYLLLYAIFFLFTFYLSLYRNQHILMVIVSFYLFTAQFFFKTFRPSEIIAATIFILLASYEQVYIEANSLFIVLIFHKIYKSNFILNKKFLFTLSIIVLFGGAYYMIGTIKSIILPVILMISFYTYDKYKFNVNFFGAFWILVLLAATLYQFFIAQELIGISNFIIPLCCLLYLIVDDKKLGALISIFIPVLLATQLYDIPNKIHRNKHEVIKSETQFEAISTKTTQRQTNSKEDRPLDFVEFPLGFSPTFSEKYGTVAVVLGKYLKMMFLPHPMSFYYGFDEIKIVEAINALAILSVVIHLLLLAIAIYFYLSHPILTFGIIAYLTSIFLFSNLAAPIAGMFGDRLTYVASFGFSIVIGYLFWWGYASFSKMGKNVLVGIFLAFILTYSGITIARNAQWENHLTLMRHDIMHIDKSAQAHNLLAANLMKYSFQKEYSQQANSMHKEAIFHFRRATEIYPDFFNAWYDLGRTYMIMNNTDSAFICFLKVHEMDSTLSDATLNIAMIADQKQDYTTAIKYYERLIKFNPYVQEGYANLSYLYFRLQQPYKSIEVNRRAIAYNPNWKDPYDNIQRVEEFLRQNNVGN